MRLGESWHSEPSIFRAGRAGGSELNSENVLSPPRPAVNDRAHRANPLRGYQLVADRDTS
jgi:hypothetical protein